MCKFTKKVLFALAAVAMLCFASCNGGENNNEEKMETISNAKDLSFTDGTYNVEYLIEASAGVMTMSGTATVSNGTLTILFTTTKTKYSSKEMYDEAIEYNKEKEGYTFDDANLTITHIEPSPEDMVMTLSELFEEFDSLVDKEEDTSKTLYKDKLIQQSEDDSIIKLSYKEENYTRDSKDEEWESKYWEKLSVSFTKK